MKRLYYERGADIERLHNTIAHQRLSQSRTSLDDNEYTSRFGRLDGAIKNVAFEVRQSWKTIPGWLSTTISSDAATKGGREMTVVGRAVISRWVVEEILEQFFHPAIEPSLSRQLKDIERNIRLFSPPSQTSEDYDAISTKVCNWRLTTLDALQDTINSKQALETRALLSEHLVNKLVATLQQHMHAPAPPGLLGGVQMVVDISIGIAANLPIESREVRAWYPMPGSRFDANYMKGEGGLPAQVTSEPEKMQTDNVSTKSGGEKTEDVPFTALQKDDNLKPGSRGGVAAVAASALAAGKDAKSKSSSFGGRVKKVLHGATTSPPVPSSPGGAAHQVPNGKVVQTMAQQGSQISLQVGADGKVEVEKIRVAGFMAVEVINRSILVKASVCL